MSNHETVGHPAVVADTSTNRTSILSVSECFALVKHLNAETDISQREEGILGELENDLRVELVAGALTAKVDRLVDLKSDESPAILSSLALWLNPSKNAEVSQ